MCVTRGNLQIVIAYFRSKENIPRIDIHAQNPFYETMEILYTLLFYGLSEIKIDIYLI